MPLPIVHRYLLDTAANLPPIVKPTYPNNRGSTVPGLNEGNVATTKTATKANPREATAEWAQNPAPATALALLDAEERAKALRYFKPADAALSTASSLLKHLAIVRLSSGGSGGSGGVAWADSHVSQSRDVDNGKPYFATPGVVAFNASHHGQAGVVAGCGGREGGVENGAEGEELPQVGVDVVLVDVERGREDLRRSGRKGGDGGSVERWTEWAGIFEEAFSAGEMAAIKGAMEPGADWEGDPAVLEKALRVFHTYWALKEAYIKMTGEAFMAGWIRELEFRNVRPPRPPVATAAAATSKKHQHHEDDNGDGEENPKWAEGETVRDIQVWLRNERLNSVTIEIQAVGRSYMIATAVNRPATIAPLELVDVQRDIVPLTAR